MNSIPIIEDLKAQHGHIAALLRQIEQATGASRAAAFDEFRGYLAAHEAAEEEFVHPAARTGQGGVVEQRLAEEHQAGTLISEMEALDVDSAEFDVKFGQLHQAVTEHAAHEEEQEFPHLAAVDNKHTLIRMRQAIKLVSSLAARTVGTGKPFIERVNSDREHLRGTADATM